MKNWKVWLHSLVASVIGGTATTLATMFVDPAAFNLNDLGKLGQLALAGAIINLVFYLQKSPVPKLEE